MTAKIIRRVSLVLLVVVAATTLSGCAVLDSLVGTYVWIKVGYGTFAQRKQVPTPTPEQMKNEAWTSGSTSQRYGGHESPMKDALTLEAIGQGADPKSLPNLNPDKE